MTMYDLLATLSSAEIDYVLVGCLAVTLHGYQRLTMDVDVVLALNDENLAKFIDCAKSAKYRRVAQDKAATGGEATWPGLN